ncbi:hypothetical protein [Micromonospora pallida]|uniref:hypothetical protein n=1 Tax=Micromonospora pallida TaxID=145854 RepID=UPI000B8956A8|nr:hypothetical protein [Micromonospora pallida]
MADQISRLAAPWFTLEAGRPDTGAWEVFADTEPTGESVPELVTAHGEETVEYAVDHSRRFLFHLAPSGDAWTAQSLLRATRAIHRSAAARQGTSFLHAGLVELNGIGVALVGGSRAGKTSFIMAGVLDGSGVMVCNDDVSMLAGDGDEGVTGFGWPRSVSVRLDTLDLLFGHDRAQAVLSRLSHPANATLPRLRESGAEPNGTALLYPWEYADLLDTKIGQHARVDVVVHLSLADDPAEATLAPVHPSERRTLLERRLLAQPNKHLNIFGHEPEPGSAEPTRDALTALPTYRFRYDFHDVRRQVDRLAGFLSSQLVGP